MLLTLQQSMQAACYGEADGFAATLRHLSPGAIAVDRALYIHVATVTAALTGVLQQAYPSLATRLDGPAFADAARCHLRRHPPQAAILSAYGDGFGADLPDGLAILAAADWAAHLAYFAADADPLPVQALAGLPPEALASLNLPLVPAARLVDGDSVLLEDWQNGRADVIAVPPVLPLDSAQAALLVWRGSDLQVAATLLPADASAFVRALADGCDLLTASALLADPGQLSLLLALLLGHGLIAASTDMVTP